MKINKYFKESENGRRKKIQQLRKQKNFTQVELAEKLNISPQAVSKWENGQSEPDFNTLRNLCVIFGVSLNDFNEPQDSADNTTQFSTTDTEGIQQEVIIVEDTQQEYESILSNPTKVILGYCKTCKEPLGAGEYVVEQSNTGVDTSVSNMYCKTCYNKIKEKRLNEKIAKNNKDIRVGCIWGAISGILGILLGIWLSSVEGILWYECILSAIFGISVFALVSQIIWDEGFVVDMFDFFTHSFTAPFGFVFELSLDGIIWLLTVKLALWIICGVLSVLWFLLGMSICLPLSIISWGFSLNAKKNDIY